MNKRIPVKFLRMTRRVCLGFVEGQWTTINKSMHKEKLKHVFYLDFLNVFFMNPKLS